MIQYPVSDVISPRNTRLTRRRRRTKFMFRYASTNAPRTANEDQAHIASR